MVRITNSSTREFETVVVKLRFFLIYFIFNLPLFSCSVNKSCEEFNFKRLPYDASDFKRNFNYSNGVDTLKLKPYDFFYTKKSVIDPVSNPECNPRFNFSFEDSSSNLQILYSFTYYADETSTEFGLVINSSSIELNMDSIKNKQKVKLNHFYHLNNIDSSRLVKSIRIKDMLITEIELSNGIIWKLI